MVGDRRPQVSVDMADMLPSSLAGVRTIKSFAWVRA